MCKLSKKTADVTCKYIALILSYVIKNQGNNVFNPMRDWLFPLQAKHSLTDPVYI